MRFHKRDRTKPITCPSISAPLFAKVFNFSIVLDSLAQTSESCADLLGCNADPADILFLASPYVTLLTTVNEMWPPSAAI